MAEIKTVQGNVSDLQSKLETKDKEIETLQGDVSDLQKKLAEKDKEI